ncbi:SDR family oxidoreductase [Acidihalobacter ferrooxydans]|uniref:Short-chain dehydrogenase n=1 Tax=Acidihalobacter ferrooxydans TaxID=1765967 RepID=A0A1P8UKN7_9GAMM|nr:SDR family oxidoreductase [Acidihalobacter ferrooxydans]APZ44406.1 short-chain dehydrogenase [Acidihalobacter ferrooxydans]
MKPTVLITGANRGIGLEFVRQYVDEGWRVHACCRHPDAANQLYELAGPDVLVHRLDVADAGQITALAGKLRDEPLDLLINNAGVYGPPGARFGALEPEGWLDTLRINSIAPLLMAQAFRNHIEAGGGRTIATLTSKMGSIGDNASGGSYIYRSSKAALNAALYSLSLDLAPHIKVLILHPGWVRTDMGGPSGEIDAVESARRLRGLIADAGPADSGRFTDIDGSTIPW